jgi:hypothetical protein
MRPTLQGTQRALVQGSAGCDCQEEERALVLPPAFMGWKLIWGGGGTE